PAVNNVWRRPAGTEQPESTPSTSPSLTAASPRGPIGRRIAGLSLLLGFRLCVAGLLVIGFGIVWLSVVWFRFFLFGIIGCRAARRSPFAAGTISTAAASCARSTESSTLSASSPRSAAEPARLRLRLLLGNGGRYKHLVPPNDGR